MKYVKYFLLTVAVVASLLASFLPHDELRLGHKMDDIFLDYFFSWLGLASYITAWFAWILFFTRLVLGDDDLKTSSARVFTNYAFFVLLDALVIWRFWQEMLQR